MPHVSVIIPNYNHAPFLERRCRSVLEQTSGDFEIIFLDDASTDNSRQVFENVLQKSVGREITGKVGQASRLSAVAAGGGDRQDACSALTASRPRSESTGLPIRAVFNEINSGSPFRQWNKGVELAHGAYVWIAESDDVADPRFLERMVSLLEAHPNVGLAYCASNVIDDQDRVVGNCDGWWDSLHPDRWRSDFINAGPDECARYLLHKCTLPNASAVVFRRDLYRRVGGADESLRYCGDWLMWVKMLLQSDIAYVAEPLNCWRRHADTVSAAYAHSATHLAEQCRVVATILRHTDVPARVRDDVSDSLMKRWLKLVREASPRPSGRDQWRLFRAAWAVDPRIPLRVLRQRLESLTPRR